MVKDGGERTPIEDKRRASEAQNDAIDSDAQNQAPQSRLVHDHGHDREEIVRRSPVIDLIEEDDRDRGQNLVRVRHH